MDTSVNPDFLCLQASHISCSFICRKLLILSRQLTTTVRELLVRSCLLATLALSVHCSYRLHRGADVCQVLQRDGPKASSPQQSSPTTAAEAAPISHPSLNPANLGNKMFSPAGQSSSSALASISVHLLQKHRAWHFQDLASTDTFITGVQAYPK